MTSALGEPAEARHRQFTFRCLWCSFGLVDQSPAGGHSHPLGHRARQGAEEGFPRGRAPKYAAGEGTLPASLFSRWNGCGLALLIKSEPLPDPAGDGQEIECLPVTLAQLRRGPGSGSNELAGSVIVGYDRP